MDPRRALSFGAQAKAYAEARPSYPADAERFLQKYPATFVLASDADEKVVKAFAVPAMPSGYLIDRRGTVRKIHTGFTSETAESLDKEIDKLLKAGQ